MKLVKIVSIICAAAGIALSSSCASASAPADTPVIPNETVPKYVDSDK